MAHRSFEELFRGAEGSYFLWSPTSKRSGSGKVEGESRAIATDIPAMAWEDHSAGVNASLAISPSLSRGTALFAVIDIDPADLKGRGLHVVVDAANLFHKHDLPFAVTQSKSCGAHCWVFFREEEQVHEVRALLEHIVASLSLKEAFNASGIDIRPTVSGTGPGAPIGLPYFGEPDPDLKDNEGLPARAMYLDGRWYSRAEFVQYCNDSCTISLPELREIVYSKFPAAATRDTVHDRRYKSLQDSLKDLPPCYTPLVQPGAVKKGEMHNGLVHLLAMIPHALKDDWQEVARDLAYQFEEPMNKEDMNRTIKARGSNIWGPKCHEAPAQAFCQKDACLKRRFGIGFVAKPQNPTQSLVITRMTKERANAEAGEEVDDYVIFFEFEGWPGQAKMDHRAMVNPAYFCSMLVAQWSSLSYKFANAEEHRQLIQDAVAKPGVVYFETARPYETTPRGKLEAALKMFVEQSAILGASGQDGECRYFPAVNNLEIPVEVVLRAIEDGGRRAQKAGGEARRQSPRNLLENSSLIEPGSPVIMDAARKGAKEKWIIRPRIVSKEYDDGIEGWFNPDSVLSAPGGF